MKKISKVMERMFAYAEGRQAFEEKRWRAFNPYKDMHEKLATSWWNGWDDSQTESSKPGINTEQRKPGEKAASLLHVPYKVKV